MQIGSMFKQFGIAALSAGMCAGAASGAFVGFFVTSTNVTNSGQNLTVYTVVARFNGATDTLLNCFNLSSSSGAGALSGFWHKDNDSGSSGVLTQSGGSWSPTLTGSATANRPYDSYLTIGGQAAATNTSTADPSWNTGGNTSAAGWNRPDLPNNGTLGWFNSSPPTLQGRVGNSPGLPTTDVRVAQFVLSANDSVARTYHLEVGYNNGVAGSAVQFGTGSFTLGLGGGCPTLYRDLDGDGFGAPSSGTVVSCTPVTGYVSTNSDCNDNDASINPNTVWYRDGDGDGFGSSVGPTLTQCNQPAGYVRSNTDCNDNNAALNPNTIWYRDTDGDGRGVAANGTLTQCTQPAGYALVNGDNCPTIANPTQADCNTNGIGDVCEIASGALLDCDGDSVPDVCEGAVVVHTVTQYLAPFGNGYPATYSFTNLPRAYTGSPTIKIEAISDLDQPNEFIGVSFDGSAQELFFVNDGSDCPATPDVAVKSFTLAAFNALVADGRLTVNITASGTVSPTQCAGGGIRLTLDYNGMPATSDCNNNGLLDSCELGTGVAFDCNGNGRIDSCDVASGIGTDCNQNGRLDSCDLSSGSSTDLDGNGVLDDCSGEYIVGGSGFANIQAALNAAPNGATIHIAPGNYAGPFDIGSKSVHLVSIAGPNTTIISGAGLGTAIISVTGSAANGTTIDGFTFRDGQIGADAYGTRMGGAIFLNGVAADVRNCKFLNNHSNVGGALCGYASSGTIENCLFDHNTAAVEAGAVELGFGGKWTFRNNLLTNNSAVGNGGAMQIVQPAGAVTAAVSLRDSDFTGNSAGGKGGAIAWSALGGVNLIVNGCTFENNTASDAAFTRLDGQLELALSHSRFCLNTPTNLATVYADIGDNILSQDCNGNGVCDADEIASGAEADCDHNGLPDSCQLIGDMRSWGDNTNGQSSIPSSIGDVWHIAAGCSHSLALKADHTMVGWGSNSFGQITIPSGLNAVNAIAAGCDHNIALRSDGTVRCWGYNAYNQCDVPAGLTGVAQVAAGANHTGVLRNDGTMVMWGRNLSGECNVPSNVGTVARIALGGAHSMALRTDGTVRCWGLNNFGQCTVPGNVGTLKEIAAGCYHSVGLRTNGTVTCWGSNIFGQLDVPAGLSNVVQIAAGSGQHTVALRSNGTLVSWGWNNFGQTNVPATAVGIVEISAGGTHTLVRSHGPSDCNSNGIVDRCEIDSGVALDCNGNGLPDSCDIASGGSADCNGNGIPDSCDIASGYATDCNGNARPDSCDLALGTSTDLDGNGRLDECSGELVVGGSGYGTIQAAMNAAPKGATVLVGPGTHRGFIHMPNNGVSMRSIGGAAVTILDGSGASQTLPDSIVTIESNGVGGGGGVIQGFTFRSGTTGHLFEGARVGGAISIISVPAMAVLDCVFESNHADRGGAIFGFDTTSLIQNCTFRSNSATLDGGAIEFSLGGGWQIRGCTMDANAAPIGGAVHLAGSEGALMNCTMTHNSATDSGGAVAWDSTGVLSVLFDSCDIEANSAAVGGGLAIVGGSGSFDLVRTRLCRNTPENISGEYTDDGDNIFSQDCNGNGICDADDISSGAETDCNGDGIPDSCQLRGETFAWGDGSRGQTIIPSNLGNIAAISAGCDHSLALRANGTLAVWGADSFGQVTIPAGLNSVIQIAAGCTHNLALRTNGQVVGWGANAFGQTNVPTAANGNVLRLAAGANHSGVLHTDGSIVLWGRNNEGQCTVPSTIGPATRLALGGAHSVALRANGSVLCWGLNNFNQCNVPANVGAVTDIAAGCYHTVALRANGTVLCWGSNLFGQLAVPAGLNGVVQIAAGSGQHTLALKSDGTVVGWGWDAFGQTDVPHGLRAIGSIAAGGAHSLALTAIAADCNGNGAIDACEIASGAVGDCNHNGIPDSCDIANGIESDCNHNGVPDNCEIASGTNSDCNGNGIPDDCDLASGLSTDLNGNGRPDECAGEFVVGGTGFASIQAAINAAPNGTTIKVAAGTWSPISISGRKVTIESLSGAAETFIEGNHTGRCVSMTNIAPHGVIMRGFTIRNGSASTGAGIRLLLSSPDFSDCVIEGNTATGPGGGVACSSSSPNFVNCVIRGNSAAQGGGVAVSGATVDNSAASFANCDISSNHASTTGGGFYNTGRLSVSLCVVEHNSAGTAGGGLWSATTGFSAVGYSRFCINTPENIYGQFNDQSGNVFGDDCNGNGICDIDEIAAGTPDENHNGQLDSCELARGDLNLDGHVDGADLGILLNFWGAVGAPAGDLNGDGVISAPDLALLLGHFDPH